MGGGHHAAAAAPTGAAPLPNRHKWVTPYTGHKVYQGHPKWLQALEAMPRGKAISGAFGATFVVAGLFWSIAMARGTISSISDFKWVLCVNVVGSFDFV